MLLQVLALQFPHPIAGFDLGFRRSHNWEEPPVLGINSPDGVVVLANEQVARPLYVGFPKDIDDKLAGVSYPILVSSALNDIFPRKSPTFPYMWLDWPRIHRPIAPHASDSYNLSLRFAPAGTPVETVAADVYANFARAYPQTVKWDDRRPIGMLFIGGLASYDRSVNPSGYRGVTVDVKTPEGKEQFKRNLLAMADNAIANLKLMHAQGVLIWDIEGYKYPETYIGDPGFLIAGNGRGRGCLHAEVSRCRVARGLNSSPAISGAPWL